MKKAKKESKLFEYTPTWQCKDCGESGSMENDAPEKCPKCGSMNINIPPVKKDGPFDGGLKRC
ncbi:MAG: hypothetical protein WC608_00455 [Parcubacteria group bacterium]